MEHILIRKLKIIFTLDLKYKNGIITAGERTRRREEIIVDGLLKKFTKGLIEIE